MYTHRFHDVRVIANCFELDRLSVEELPDAENFGRIINSISLRYFENSTCRHVYFEVVVLINFGFVVLHIGMSSLRNIQSCR